MKIFGILSGIPKCRIDLGEPDSDMHTLVCRIDVHARLLILRKNPPPAHLFHPARVLVLVLHVY